MAASISVSVVTCLKSFNDFIAKIKCSPSAHIEGLIVEAWEDELGRLRMWAANVGAHQTSQSSLDFRLRDASPVREQILKLLNSLRQRLQDGRDLLADNDDSPEEDFADDLSTDDGEVPKTEIQELQESVATTINCLFQMAILVRKPAKHDLLLGSRRVDVQNFEEFDYSHVREQFPKADELLVRRLADAITRRRKYLKCRERHALKLKQGIKDVDVNEGRTVMDGDKSILPDTIATDFQNPNIEFDDGVSDPGVSQTSYTPTLISSGDVTIPPPPKESRGGTPFECPYCYFIITVHDAQAWIKHVFQDLQPYVCITPKCPKPDTMYATKHEWLHHWKTFHLGELDSRAREPFTCPLCHLRMGYDYHTARHLEELSLFILPRIEEDSDMESDEDPVRDDLSIDLAEIPDGDEANVSDGLAGAITTQILEKIQQIQQILNRQLDYFKHEQEFLIHRLEDKLADDIELFTQERIDLNQRAREQAEGYGQRMKKLQARIQERQPISLTRKQRYFIQAIEKEQEAHVQRLQAIGEEEENFFRKRQEEKGVFKGGFRYQQEWERQENLLKTNKETLELGKSPNPTPRPRKKADLLVDIDQGSNWYQNRLAWAKLANRSDDGESEDVNKQPVSGELEAEGWAGKDGEGEQVASGRVGEGVEKRTEEREEEIRGGET